MTVEWGGAQRLQLIVCKVLQREAYFCAARSRNVVDIVLTWLLSPPDLTILFGDNVHANDQLYHQVFPYSATPHAGTTDVRS